MSNADESINTKVNNKIEENKENTEAKSSKRQLTKTIEYTRGGLFDKPDPRDKKALKRQKMNRIMLFNIVAISVFFVPFYLIALCVNKYFKPCINEEELQLKSLANNAAEVAAQISGNAKK